MEEISRRLNTGEATGIRRVHLKEGEPLVIAVQDLITARKFFGDDFARAAGNRRFATRKANKAYLQGIELTAENEPGKLKGYMLAALARSHKGGIGKLPEITDLYLKDAHSLDIVRSSYSWKCLREVFLDLYQQ